MKKFIFIMCMLLGSLMLFAQTPILDGYTTISYSNVKESSNYYEFCYMVEENYAKDFSSEKEVEDYLKDVTRETILTEKSLIPIFMAEFPAEYKFYQPEKDSNEYKKVMKNLILKDGKKVQVFTQLAIAAGSAVIISHVKWNDKIYSIDYEVFFY